MLVYLYHALEGEPVKQAILRAVTAVRRVTVKHAASRALARDDRARLGALRRRRHALQAAVAFPRDARARRQDAATRATRDYPLRVIVNDQFDRFSAPIENRYRRDEVQGWLTRAGLEQTDIRPGYGWRAVGTVGDGGDALNQRGHALNNR